MKESTKAMFILFTKLNKKEEIYYLITYQTKLYF